MLLYKLYGYPQIHEMARFIGIQLILDRLGVACKSWLSQIQ